MRLLMLFLLAAAVAWFAPAPISRATNTVVISAPRDRVWAVLSELSAARLWDPGMKEAKLTSDAKIGEGTVRESSDAFGKTKERVIEWLSYNRLKLETSHDPALTRYETSTIELEPAGASTRVEWTMDYQMNGGYLGMLADKALLGSAHQGRIDQALANLKRYVETGEPTNF